MRHLRAPAGPHGAREALAAVAVALFGIMSMHGWGSHAGAHAVGVTPPDVDVTIASTDLGAHGHSASVAPGAVGAAQASPVHLAGMQSEDREGESDAGMLGLCLAVLAGLLLGIAGLLARQGVRVARTWVPAWRPPVFIGRDRGPPSLSALCVIRC